MAEGEAAAAAATADGEAEAAAEGASLPAEVLALQQMQKTIHRQLSMQVRENGAGWEGGEAMGGGASPHS